MNTTFELIFIPLLVTLFIGAVLNWLFAIRGTDRAYSKKVLFRTIFSVQFVNLTYVIYLMILLPRLGVAQIVCKWITTCTSSENR